MVGKLAIKPDSSGGGCWVLKQSSFMWVSADLLGILVGITNPILAVLLKY